MKNAKKLLSLVLVLVLAMSLIPFASAKPAEKNANDYPDFDGFNEDYIEAIDVVTALGVMEGYDTGSFGYANTITRAEAAAILTRSIVGTAAAKRLGPAGPRFTDVPRDHWANPYVEYCAANGIIDGYGDGTFHPSEPVTASQMAKLLLMAIGYGRKGEYVGPNWELFTISDGQRFRILTTDSDYTAPAMREEVAQFTFNALARAKLVTYNSVLDNYFENDDNVWGSDSNYITLGQKTFGLYATADIDAYGFTGRFWSARTPMVKELTGCYQTDLILSKSTDGTPINATSGTSRSLTVKGRQGYVAPLHYDLAFTPIYVNGRLAGTPGFISQDDALRLANTSGVTVYLCDSIYSLYDGEVDSIVIIAKTVHEASGSPIVNASGQVTIPGVTAGMLQYVLSSNNTVAPYAGTNTANDITGLSRAAVNRPKDTEIEYPDDIVAGDILLVHEKFEDGFLVTVVEKAATVTGQMTQAKSTVPQNITFDGSVFKQSGLTPGVLFTPGTGYVEMFTDVPPFAVTHVTDILTNDNFDKDATLWLDDNGDVVRAKLGKPELAKYGLVLQYKYELVGLRPTAWVMMANSDNEVSVYNVAPSTTTNVVPDQYAALTGSAKAAGTLATSGTAGTTLSNGIALVAYRINEAGEITFEIPGNDRSATPVARSIGNQTQSGGYSRLTSVVNTSAAPSRMHITSDTAVYYFDYTTAPGTYHAVNNPVYAGTGTSGANMDVTGGTAISYVRAVDANGIATNNLAAIVFSVRNNAASNTKWAFVANLSFTRSYMQGTTRLYDYTVYEDGAEITLTSDSPSLFGTDVGLYSYTVNSVTGRVNVSSVAKSQAPTRTNPYGVKIQSATNGASGGSIVWGADGVTPYDSYAVNSSTKYYMYMPTNPDQPNRGGTLVAMSAPLIANALDQVEYRLWGIQTNNSTQIGAAVYYDAYVAAVTPPTAPVTGFTMYMQNTTNNIGIVGSLDGKSYELVAYTANYLNPIAPTAAGTNATVISPLALSNTALSNIPTFTAGAAGTPYVVWYREVGTTALIQQTITTLANGQVAALQTVNNAAGAANTVAVANFNAASGGTEADTAMVATYYQGKLAAATANSFQTPAAVTAFLETTNLELANAIKDLLAGATWSQDGGAGSLLVTTGTIDTTSIIATGALPTSSVIITAIGGTLPAGGTAVSTPMTGIAFDGSSATNHAGLTATAIMTGTLTGAGTVDITFTVTVGTQVSTAATIANIAFANT